MFYASTHCNKWPPTRVHHFSVVLQYGARRISECDTKKIVPFEEFRRIVAIFLVILCSIVTVIVPLSLQMEIAFVIIRPQDTRVPPTRYLLFWQRTIILLLSQLSYRTLYCAMVSLWHGHGAPVPSKALTISIVRFVLFEIRNRSVKMAPTRHDRTIDACKSLPENGWQT